MSAQIAAPAHILIVDDDPGLNRLIQRTVRRAGHEFTSAATAEEAIECLQERQPALMLLDLKLPDAEGGELIDRLEQQDLRVPFIVITGQGDERVAVQMMKRGASDYLVKDADFLNFLPTVIERVLGRVETEKALAARIRQQAAVAALGKKLFGDASFEGLLRETAQLLAETFEADFSQVLELSPDRKTLLLRAGIGWRPDSVGHSTVEVKETPAGLALATLEPVITPDLHDDPRFKAPSLLASHKVTSSVVVPIYDRETPYGVLSVDTTRRRQFSGDDVHFLQSLANILSQAIERRRAEKELLAVIGREQRRIGQDLHDGLGQRLTGIELMSHVLEEELADQKLPQAAQAGRIAEHVREAISQTRMLARGLFPVQLEDDGFMAAIQELAHSIQSLFNIECTFDCHTPFLVKSNDRSIHLYRIVQEAINNAVKHGKPSQISLRLDHIHGKQTIQIEDNGNGLPPKTGPAGMGLRIMKHRAAMIGAQVEIQPASSGGVLVTCTLDES
jgi:signal transduction histidine kinase